MLRTELFDDCKARCVFLVGDRARVLVALGDSSLEEAERLWSAMDVPEDDFEAGGYILVLFERIAMFGVVAVRSRTAARELAPFVGAST
jgi:hypothetical protein